MKPEVVTAVLVAALAGFSALGRRPPPPPVLQRSRAAGSSRPTALCPPGTLPDQGVCIPVPRPPRTSVRDIEGAIPKRPDRPADYAAYRLPVADSGSPAALPSEATAAPDGGAHRLAISITALAGTPVSALALDGQVGATESVFAGELRQTVITLHTVQTGARRSDYVTVIRNLDDARVLPPKSDLANGAPLGKVGAGPITLETRLVLPGVDPFAVEADRLLEDSETTAVDPRNVLPRRR